MCGLGTLVFFTTIFLKFTIFLGVWVIILNKRSGLLDLCFMISVVIIMVIVVAVVKTSNSRFETLNRAELSNVSYFSDVCLRYANGKNVSEFDLRLNESSGNYVLSYLKDGLLIDDIGEKLNCTRRYVYSVMRSISSKGIIIKGGKGEDNSIIRYSVTDGREVC